MTDLMNGRRNGMYRMISLVLAVVFAVVGLLFLIVPGGVLRFFNDLSVSAGLQPSSVEGGNFYLVLAVAYMYCVTVLAWSMYRRPENLFPAVLLVHAKLASSAISLVVFFVVSHALIYLTNGIVDGLIGAGVFALYRRMRNPQ